jgi:predicted transcriptional regulator
MRDKRGYNDPYWGAIILDFLRVLHFDDLSASEYRLFFFLTDKMSRKDNRIDMRQSVISLMLNMDKATVSKAINKLCKLQFIAKLGTGSFMVNPHLIYVGHRGLDRLRDDFDDILQKKGLKLRFDMNDPTRGLEDYNVENRDFVQ